MFRGRGRPKIPVGERPSALRLLQALLTWWQEAEQPSVWETRKLLQDDSRSWAWGPQTPRLPSHAVRGSPHHEACGPQLPPASILWDIGLTSTEPPDGCPSQGLQARGWWDIPAPQRPGQGRERAARKGCSACDPLSGRMRAELSHASGPMPWAQSIAWLASG